MTDETADGGTPGGARGSGRPPGAAVPMVLMYHSVSPYEQDPYLVTVSPARFGQQMGWLRRRGLRGVSVSELLSSRQPGGTRRLVGLTFDDGYADFLEYALPVLSRYGFGATVFPIAGLLGGQNDWDAAGPRKPLMTAAQVRQAAEAGIEIGSHGLRHVPLPGGVTAALAAEAAESRAILRAVSGQDVAGFCYPYGLADGQAADAVRAAGYSYGCAIWRTPVTGPLALPRVYVGDADSSWRLRAKGARHWLTWGYRGPGARPLAQVVDRRPLTGGRAGPGAGNTAIGVMRLPRFTDVRICRSWQTHHVIAGRGHDGGSAVVATATEGTIAVSEPHLSLAVNGRERQLHHKLVPFPAPAHGHRNGNGRPGGPATWSAAIVGLGYVGLPTALALHGRCPRITGIDVSEEKLAAITARDADLAETDRPRLEAALADGSLELTADPGAIAGADAVIICVPTPVDRSHQPDLTALRVACASVVAHARPGQTIILTSTTYVGTTRELLTGPLEARGLCAGADVYVAFSPERIDPGNPDHLQRETPRVVGGATAACAGRAAWVISHFTDAVYLVSSTEAAEATKLYENIFRAVSLALANEFADDCAVLGLDPVEVTVAAGTKPYGFLGTLPGPGVGGHCIPCDPHYLLWQLRRHGLASPLIEQAMRSIELRPAKVADRAAELLAGAGEQLAGSKVIVVGAAYKAGVRDLRESPALPLMASLARRGADVSYHDPLVPVVELDGGRALASVAVPRGADYDLAIVHTLHPGADYSWVAGCPHVLDATYQLDGITHRVVV